MQPTAELISKFFNRQCTDAEAEQVYRFFNENPGELEKYLQEEEWKNFTQYSQLQEERTTRMLSKILSHVDDAPLAKIVKMRNRLLAGVAAVFCLFVGYLLFFDTTTPKPNTAKAVANQEQINWKSDVNNKTYAQNILLDDGSTVALAPKSTIKYQLPFKRQQRNIYLTGKAKFFVAKDKLRPFTVYGGPLATTALGTVFTVAAWPGSKTIRVRLLSGKVKVWQHNNANPTNILLLPGKELVFEEDKQMVKVSTFSTPATPPLIEGTTKISGDNVKFINQQLPAVMHKLQEVYGVRIVAKPNLKKYYFTGEFNTSRDSISNVLNTIISLNNLKYTLTDSTYTITKP